MKRFLFLLLSVFLCFTLIVPAFASESTDVGTTNNYYTSYVTEDGDTIYITVENNEVVTDFTEGEMVGLMTYPDSSASLYTVTADDANGLKAVMLSLIGDYEGIVVEYAYTNSNGSTSYTREIQLDYPWLCACAIFLVVLFCVLRGGFAVLCRK